jgi:hypothetical protein
MPPWERPEQSGSGLSHGAPIIGESEVNGLLLQGCLISLNPSIDEIEVVFRSHSAH